MRPRKHHPIETEAATGHAHAGMFLPVPPIHSHGAYRTMLPAFEIF